MRFKTEPLRKTMENSDSEPELDTEIHGYVSSVKLEVDTDNTLTGDDINVDTGAAGIDITPAQALLLASLASADRGVVKHSGGWAPGWGAPTTSSLCTARSFEARNAQDKLRQIAELGHIKVELDDSHDVSSGENPQEGSQTTTEFPTIMNSAVPSSQTTFTPGQAQPLVMPGGEHVMLLPNPAMGPNQYFLAAPSIGTPLVQQQQQQQQQHITNGSVDLPAHNDWPGQYNFQVKIEEKEITTKSPMWMMSSITKKLYTNINKPVPFEIRMAHRPPGVKFNVRATLIYSSQQYMRTNVNRCPNHAAPTDPSNHDFPYPEHVVRADHPGANYEKHPSGRLSVVVPLDNLQDGMEFTPILLRFMCLGSCVGGIYRRAIAVILALEDMSGRTVGRRSIQVRVCACPTRDIKTDEMQYENKGIKRKGSAGIIETKFISRKSKTKVPKLEPADDDDDDDQIYYLPVRGRKLYNYLNDMMMVFSRHFPDHSRCVDVEAPAEENLQQNPSRLMELKKNGSKSKLFKPKIPKSTKSISKGCSEQNQNVIIQNSAINNRTQNYPNIIIQNSLSSEKYSDEMFQSIANGEVLICNNKKVDNVTIKTKPVVSSSNSKGTTQQQHFFFKNPSLENDTPQIQMTTKNKNKLIQIPKVREEMQIARNNVNPFTFPVHSPSTKQLPTDKETLIHMPEDGEETSFDVGVLTRHIPVVPITHFIPPRTKLIKAKSYPMQRVNVISDNIPVFSRASSSSTIRLSKGEITSKDAEENPYSPSVDSVFNSSVRPTVQFLSPDSPEMMAANVLISGLKHSLPKEIKKPPDEPGE